MSSQKDVNGGLVKCYLNSIKEHFSNFLLERIVNLQDANVRLIEIIDDTNNNRFREIQLFIIVSRTVIGMLLLCY